MEFKLGEVYIYPKTGHIIQIVDTYAENRGHFKFKHLIRNKSTKGFLTSDHFHPENKYAMKLVPYMQYHTKLWKVMNPEVTDGEI